MTRLERLRAEVTHARRPRYGNGYATIDADLLAALLAVSDAALARRRLAHGRDPQAYLTALAAEDAALAALDGAAEEGA